MGGSDENARVINGATPPAFNFFSAAHNAYSTVRSQAPRMTDNIGLIASIAKTKFIDGGVMDDRRNQVWARLLTGVC